MSIDMIQLIEETIVANPRCQLGLMLQPRAFYREKDSPELLTLIFADDPSRHYFYGHVLTHPHQPDCFVAILAWSKKFINAPTVPLYFARYRFWMEERGEYELCVAQTPEDVYGESASFSGAVWLLKKMIDRFDFESRFVPGECPDEVYSRTDRRILCIYGIDDGADEHWFYRTLPPMPEKPDERTHRA